MVRKGKYDFTKDEFYVAMAKMKSLFFIVFKLEN